MALPLNSLCGDMDVLKRISGFMLLTLAIVGCGAAPTATVTCYPVKGKVTLADGKPGAQLVLLFDPKPGPKGVGQKATGKTNDNGEFELTTVDKPGAGVGAYTVSVSMTKMKKMPAGANKIPKKYWDAEGSPLEFTVEAKENMAEFVLK
jgi:hypothetical protein